MITIETVRHNMETNREMIVILSLRQSNKIWKSGREKKSERAREIERERERERERGGEERESVWQRGYGGRYNDSQD